MKRYPVSIARERLAEVLDEAERSGSAIIERRSVQYLVTPKPKAARRKPGRSVIEALDPAVDRGDWQWEWEPGGLTFKDRRSKP